MANALGLGRSVAVGHGDCRLSQNEIWNRTPVLDRWDNGRFVARRSIRLSRFRRRTAGSVAQ